MFTLYTKYDYTDLACISLLCCAYVDLGSISLEKDATLFGSMLQASETLLH